MHKHRGPDFVPFNRPALTGREEVYLADVMRRRKFAGGGPFSKRCNDWLTDRFGVPMALVEPSFPEEATTTTPASTAALAAAAAASVSHVPENVPPPRLMLITSQRPPEAVWSAL